MKTCPHCGKKFNWLQRAVGENKEHARNCCGPHNSKDKRSLATTCRGCPAGCFEGLYDNKDGKN